MSVENDRTNSLDCVLDEVKQIVGEQMSLATEQIQDSSDLENDLGCDSLDVIEITMEIEEHFDITVPDDLSRQIRTVGDIAHGVLGLTRQRG